MPTKSTQSYLDSLNPRQKEAATLGDGPALVRAGPGTGKTQALVGRVVHLLNERKIAPQKIFVATFTRAAAAEMKERIAKHAGPTAQNLFIGTFHSRAFSLLSRLGYSLNIMDARQGKALIKEAMKKVPIPESSFFEVEQNIAFWRSRTLSPERALDSVSRSKIEAVPSAKAYAVFEELRAERNLVDYEDLLLMATRDAVTQNAFEGRFEHFVVDEYQDINLRQEHFLKALMGESTNLWVVGDEDQAIYGFRGSNLRFMQNFAQTWPGAALVNLQEHYRSPQSIIDAALGLFAKEAGRAPKKLSSTRSTAALLALNGSVTPESEARLFLDNIRRLIKSGVPQSEIAILARARWLLEPVLAELRDDDTLSSVNVELSEKRGGVIVDTIHAAKGLEWRAVFLIGLEDGTLPDYRAES
ncbi:UvrD-helicase domain-containing protein, partial [Myxococcota bacterium]|nr:UvrD-helicase domain-containing protein [Myxococcota bacterium]